MNDGRGLKPRPSFVCTGVCEDLTGVSMTSTPRGAGRFLGARPLLAPCEPHSVQCGRTDDRTGFAVQRL